MDVMKYQVGMLVEQPKRPEWGPGKVIHVSLPKVFVDYSYRYDGPRLYIILTF